MTLCSNFLDYIFVNQYNELKRLVWQVILCIFGQPMSQSLTDCNFLKIGDILMLQK